MKSMHLIKQDNRVLIKDEGLDGFAGEIKLSGWTGSIIASTGAGWDHVSVMPYDESIVPSWEDMCNIKDIFFKDDETAIQIHPPKNEYVNNVTNCLHLWRCNYRPMVMPPSVLVGVRKGQTRESFEKELNQAFEEVKIYNESSNVGYNKQA